MSLGKNLQFLRKMHNTMTQEELAEKLKVSRQTVSKWEADAMYPEMEKVFELCSLFSCSMDQLLRQDMNVCREAYTNLRTETVAGFRYVQYAVVSPCPEEDAICHVRQWAEKQGLSGDSCQIIGWDFPYVSQKQINVFHMHGYAAACILPDAFKTDCKDMETIVQDTAQYAAITILEPMKSPFDLIPNAYKTLMSYMEINGFKHREGEGVINCFEKEYVADGVKYMDVYIAMEG